MEGGRVAGLWENCVRTSRQELRLGPRDGSLAEPEPGPVSRQVATRRVRACRTPRWGSPDLPDWAWPGLRSCVQSPVHGSVGPRDDLERAGFGRSRSPTAAGRPVPRRVANTRSPERPDGKACGPNFRQARCNFLLAARIGDTAGVGVRPRSVSGTRESTREGRVHFSQFKI